MRIKEKLQSLVARYRELEELLCQPDVLQDQQRYTTFNRERVELQPICEAFHHYLQLEQRLAEDKEALADPELKELAAEEIPELESQLTELEHTINVLLLPKDPNDERNTILEVRSGTGGEEAALFAGDLFRMYSRYAEQRRWKVEVLSLSPAAAGGIKEVSMLIQGERVYSVLRFEGGVHRVQRVPSTESQGRIHTSTATVAVLPEAEDVDVNIRDEDLEISIAAASGPGGQGVNTTNSAVQILHKPTNIIVRCQDERSQIKNKAKALKVLRARLLEREQQAQADAVSAERRGMVGSGDRSEKIRTYNFPQNRVTDHRIQLTAHNLTAFMDGALEEMITSLRTHHQAELLHLQGEN